jgi:Helix-turn-helix domain
VNPCLASTTSGRYLSFAEREEITLLRARNFGMRAVARHLGRSPSTISRELRRNASTRTYRLEYRASLAQWRAERRAQRPKTAKLVVSQRLHDYVQDRLAGTVVHAADGKVVEGPQVRPWQGRKSRRTRSGRAAACGSGIVVRCRRLRCRPASPAAPISRAMRLRPQAVPSRLRTAWRRGAP